MKASLLLTVCGVLSLNAADLERGKILEDVACQAHPSQHYALFLPSNYSPQKQWPVLYLFDAGGRGQRGVERYQAAAEKYGYILAGSNNSRNGPWEISLNAAAAMMQDIGQRFRVNTARVYTGGMSGGARVAMKLALDDDSIAGVFASSAGFPEDFLEKVPFLVFGSAGTDDFNHQEMRALDAGLRSPHRIEYFEGGHTWLPEALATDGVEWMELQAMRTGKRHRDGKLIDELFVRRNARADAAANDLQKLREVNSIATDFAIFKDITKVKARAVELEKLASVKDALKAERNEAEQETRTQAELFQLRDRMNNPASFAQLKMRALSLLGNSKASSDSMNRRVARRVLTGFNASSRSIRNPDFQELLNQIRSAPADPGRQP